MSRPPNSSLSENRKLLQNPYAFLNGDGEYEAAPRSSKASSRVSATVDVARIRDGALRERRGADEKLYSSHEIETMVRRMQGALWRTRKEIWGNRAPEDPIDVLDPLAALALLKYQSDLAESLGQYFYRGVPVEVAGMIDGDSSKVRISRQFSSDVRNFTAAHELGHAVLHPANGLHRDRPLDHAGLSSSRDPMEQEADKFASYFLMPGKLVIKYFEEIYGIAPFSLTEETFFALDPTGALEASGKIKLVRDLSRLLASAEQYGGAHFTSIANRFRVSKEAMAIRLEELELIKF